MTTTLEHYNHSAENDLRTTSMKRLGFEVNFYKKYQKQYQLMGKVYFY